MAYRRAAAADIETLTALRLDMLNEEKPLAPSLQGEIAANAAAYMERGMQNGSLVTWVAEQDGSIVAMGCVNFFALPPNDHCPNGKTACIGNLYVRPQCRGWGFAAGILDRLLDEAGERGCQRVLLNTTEQGKPLYQKAGFRDSDTAMALYPFERPGN